MVTAMTRHEAMRYWLMKYNSAKSYTDDHWEAEERHEHEEYVEACEQAFKALDVVSNEKYVELKDGLKKFRSGNFVVYDINYLLENLAREVYLLMGAIHDDPKSSIDEFRQRLKDEEIARQINSQLIKPLKIDKEGRLIVDEQDR